MDKYAKNCELSDKDTTELNLNNPNDFEKDREYDFYENQRNSFGGSYNGNRPSSWGNSGSSWGTGGSSWGGGGSSWGDNRGWSSWGNDNSYTGNGREEGNLKVFLNYVFSFYYYFK